MSKLYDKIICIDLPDEAASVAFAHQLAQCISAPLLFTFSGEIGAGKTTIIRALLTRMGIQSTIKSPTFSLVESYHWGDVPVHHFDLYRIKDEEELEYLGFRDYFAEHCICLIEWAEHAGKRLPTADIRFNLSSKGAGRVLQLQALSETGEGILACLAGA